MDVLSFNSLPLGFRFRPTDEELVNYYLRHKINGHHEDVSVIREIDVCKFEPSDLPDLSIIKTNDPEWCFFCPLDRKYPTGQRLNRATVKGYWKATGKDRKVKSGNNLIGMKKTLVYYVGRAPHGKRTPWVMHEYRATQDDLDGSHPGQAAFVLCRLFNKEGSAEGLNAEDVEPAVSSPTAAQSSLEVTQPEPELVQASPGITVTSEIPAAVADKVLEDGDADGEMWESPCGDGQDDVDIVSMFYDPPPESLDDGIFSPPPIFQQVFESKRDVGDSSRGVQLAHVSGVTEDISELLDSFLIPSAAVADKALEDGDADGEMWESPCGDGLDDVDIVSMFDDPPPESLDDRIFSPPPIFQQVFESKRDVGDSSRGLQLAHVSGVTEDISELLDSFLIPSNEYYSQASEIEGSAFPEEKPSLHCEVIQDDNRIPHFEIGRNELGVAPTDTTSQIYPSVSGTNDIRIRTGRFNSVGINDTGITIGARTNQPRIETFSKQGNAPRRLRLQVHRKLQVQPLQFGKVLEDGEFISGERQTEEVASEEVEVKESVDGVDTSAIHANQKVHTLETDEINKSSEDHLTSSGADIRRRKSNAIPRKVPFLKASSACPSRWSIAFFRVAVLVVLFVTVASTCRFLTYIVA